MKKNVVKVRKKVEKSRIIPDKIWYSDNRISDSIIYPNDNPIYPVGYPNPIGALLSFPLFSFAFFPRSSFLSYLWKKFFHFLTVRLLFQTETHHSMEKRNQVRLLAQHLTGPSGSGSKIATPLSQCLILGDQVVVSRSRAGYLSSALGSDDHFNFSFTLESECSRSSVIRRDPKMVLPKFRKFTQQSLMTVPISPTDGQVCQIVPCETFTTSYVPMVSSMTHVLPIIPLAKNTTVAPCSIIGDISSAVASRTEYRGKSKIKVGGVVASVLSTDVLDPGIKNVSDSLSTLHISESIVFHCMVLNKLMDEITVASNILTGRYYEIVSSRNNEVVCATKLLYFGIQRVLQSCQSFSYFRELSSKDQETVIKGSCTEMLLIRSLFHVNLELDAWIFYSPSTTVSEERISNFVSIDITRILSPISSHLLFQ